MAVGCGHCCVVWCSVESVARLMDERSTIESTVVMLSDELVPLATTPYSNTPLTQKCIW